MRAFQNPSQVMIAVETDAAADTFGVFPTVLGPSEPFTLILRDADGIPVMENDNIFEVPVSEFTPFFIFDNFSFYFFN